MPINSSIMGDNPCTVDALRKAFTSDLPPAKVVPNPVLQVLQIKPIAAQASAPERYVRISCLAKENDRI